MIFIRGQESCSFLFPVLGSLGASLLAEEASGEEAAGYGGFCGQGIACRLRATGSSQSGQPGRPEGSHRGQRSAAEMVAAPSAMPPPSWQVVGCACGGKQPGFLSVWLQDLISWPPRCCEIETGVNPQLSELVPLPDCVSPECLWLPLGPLRLSTGRSPLVGKVCSVFLLPISEPLSCRPGLRVTSTQAPI